MRGLPRVIAAWTFAALTMAQGAARAESIYSASETFSEPEFGLVLAIQAGDEAEARRRKWLPAVKADDRLRRTMLLKIKDAVARKGISLD